MFQADSIRNLLDTRKPGHALPRDFYIASDVYEADLASIFHREWIFAGHTFELERPGSYVTLQIGLCPILIVRGKDGEIRALHNVCRHRGQLLCHQERGHARRFVCCYHQWAYDLDGTLRFARAMGDDFDKSNYGLKSVHCEIVSTCIFVSVADVPPDFESFREQIAPYLAPHQLEDAKVAHESTVIENGNWKLVIENNRECYHCDANHPQLLRAFVEDTTVSGVAPPAEDSQTRALWARCEEIGFPGSLKLDSKGQFRIVRIPLAEGTCSYTMSGMPAVQTPACDTRNENIGALLLSHYPSTWMHFLADHAITFCVLPLGPTQTMVTTKWLVNRNAREGQDYDLDNLTHVWTNTNQQDKYLVEGASRGVASPAFEPGPFSEEEAGPNQFVDWYCAVTAAYFNQQADAFRSITASR